MRITLNEDGVGAPTEIEDVVIADGDDTSSACRLAGDSLVGFIIPASFEGTSITYEVSIDGATWYPLNVTAETVAASNAYEVCATCVYGWPFLRLVSNAAASGADRTIRLLIKRL